MWISTLWDQGMPAVQWGVVIGTSLLAAVTDLRSRRIPNLLTGPVLLAGLIWATWVGGLAGLGDAAVGCLLLAWPFVLLFIFAGGGAGDAKLMGAIGAWLGVISGSVVLVSVLLSGMVLGVCFAIARKQAWSVMANLAQVARQMLMFISVVVLRRQLRGAPALIPRIQDMQTMPYGLAVLLGVCAAAGGIFAWNT